jgi:hypothetical protein
MPLPNQETYKKVKEELELLTVYTIIVRGTTHDDAGVEVTIPFGNDGDLLRNVVRIATATALIDDIFYITVKDGDTSKIVCSAQKLGSYFTLYDGNKDEFYTPITSVFESVDYKNYAFLNAVYELFVIMGCS